MKHGNLAVLAFAALALPATSYATPKTDPMPVPDGASIFLDRMAGEIAARSQMNCDPSADPAGRNATLKPLLSVLRESRRPDAEGNVSFTEAIGSMGMANNAFYSVCFNSALKDAPEAAVVYNGGSTRMITLNPGLSDIDVEKALLQSYHSIKAGWNSVNEGKRERADFEKPQSILLDGAKAGASLPATPPHNIFRLIREIDTRSAEVCAPEREAKEAEGHRVLNIGLPAQHSAFENQKQVMSLLEAINNAQYSVCIDKDLRQSDDLAVVYNGKARIIALKPNPPKDDFQAVLLRTYTRIQQDQAALAAGQKTQEAVDTPYAIRDSSDSAPAITSKAPHRNAALQ